MVISKFEFMTESNPLYKTGEKGLDVHIQTIKRTLSLYYPYKRVMPRE